MRVWIEQDDCTGCGQCPEIAPPVFDMHNDGLAYVKADTKNLEMVNGQPKYRGVLGAVAVREGLEDAVIEAAQECPGDCIYIEVDVAETVAS